MTNTKEILLGILLGFFVFTLVWLSFLLVFLNEIPLVNIQNTTLNLTMNTFVFDNQTILTNFPPIRSRTQAIYNEHLDYDEVCYYEFEIKEFIEKLERKK